MNQICRLSDKADRLYSGQMLDRARTIEFSLDGQVYSGFHGDTVLSALLANGVGEFGHYRGEPLSLDGRFHPPVTYSGSVKNAAVAMAMDRTFITDGMELISLAAHDTDSTGLQKRIGRYWQRLRGRTPTSLSLDPESVSPFPGPWTELDPEQIISADLIVVGGGIGGLAAARAGAEHGWSVILIEQMAVLGGDATFFGSEDGEVSAPEIVAGITAELRSFQRVEIYTSTEVLGYSGGNLRAHQIMKDGDRPVGRIIAFQGTNVVLSTGAHERLPLFSGNRLPGVNGARAAHRMASNFGVWRGKNAIINTASSAATQVALQAADMGIKIVKLADSRAAPESRFFEFAKAYGVPLATGLRVSSAELASDKQLDVHFELAGSGKANAEGGERTDQLLVCGGWQSDLNLWNMAGGRSAWDGQRQQLRAVGEVEGFELAGWCKGAKTPEQCAASGEDAVRRVTGSRSIVAQMDVVGDPRESDDGELPITRPRVEAPRCFLDNGYSFSTLRPSPDPAGRVKSFLGLGVQEPGLELRALSLNDVSAKVILGKITPAIAGDFAKERCVTPGQIDTGGSKDFLAEKLHTGRKVPDFLRGRFGASEKMVELAPAGGQGVEVGCLIFQTSSQTRPDQSIGVVLGVDVADQGRVKGYLAVDQLTSNQRLVARIGERSVDLELIGQVRRD